MKLSKYHYKKLKAEKKNRRAILIESLLNSNIKEAKDNAEWIELSDKLVAHNRTRSTYIVAISVGIVCLLVIGIVNSVHVKSTKVSLEISTDAFTLNLDEDWESQRTIKADYISLDKIDSLSNSFKPSILKSSTPSSFEVIGKNIEVKNIKVDSNAKIDVQFFNRDLNLFVKKSGLSGKASLRKGEIIIDGISDSINVEMNRSKTTYAFFAEKRNIDIEAIRLDIENASLLGLKGLPVKNITFQVENPPESGIFKSTVIQGSIVLYDTKQNISLLEDEFLFIEFDKCHKSSFLINNNKIEITLMGLATKINGGTEVNSLNYKPTILEYMYYNKKIALFWSSLVFLFGFLWSAKKIIFNK